MIDVGQTESAEHGQSPVADSSVTVASTSHSPATEPTPTLAAPSEVATNGDFERYGLLAALTLVVLALLLADRLRPSQDLATVPPTDRLLRVRIGGNIPRAPSQPRSPVAPPPRGGARVTKEPAPQVHLDPPRGGTPVPTPVPADTARRAATVVVQSGETLGEIALRELGTSKRAQEIATLNGITDLTKVREGRTLRLPAR